MRRTGYADFWELYRRNVLPQETRNYVPIIVAVTIMAKNPDQYGLTDVVREKPIPYDTVKIDYPIDLRLVAECVDASADELQELNPSLLRMTTPKFSETRQPFELHLPAGTTEKFQSVVALIPADKRVWWRYHKVLPGETLASIARTYRSSADSIAEANDLRETSLSPETRLIIPIAPGIESEKATYAKAITRYKIRKGDTVQSVAENFGVPVKMVETWNHLRGNSLAGRKTLLVHMPVREGARETRVASKGSSANRTTTSRTASQPTATSRSNSRQHAETQHAEIKSAPASGMVHHKVRAGETLFSIASSYNTTVAELKHDNRNIAVLRPGMVLVIHGAR